jgi:hypothetical protein
MNQKIELTYDLGQSTVVRTYEVYGMDITDVELERRLIRLLDGSFVEYPVGYRYRMRAELKPLLGDKAKLFDLQGFFIGRNKKVRLLDDEKELMGSRNVSGTADTIDFEYVDGLVFGNRITLDLVEKETRTITDDGSTRILKPVYGFSASLSGNTLTVPANLVDEGSLNLYRHQLDFFGGNVDEVCRAFNRSFTLDLGVISDSDHWTWLIEFALWKNKQLDLSAIDPLNYPNPISVVCADEKMVWKTRLGLIKPATKLFGGLSISMKFFEKTAQTDKFTPVIPQEPFITEGYAPTPAE